MNLKTAASGVTTACMVISLLAGIAFAQTGAKAIFYGNQGTKVMAQSPPPKSTPETSAPVKDEYMGMEYWIELLGKDGQKRRVTTDRVFRSGDRIKLHVQSNRDGYLYVVNTGSTGRTYMLFPSPAAGMGSNAIRANVTHQIPATSYIRFDDNPGEETLLVMLSPAPMGDAPPAVDRQTASLSTEDAARLLMNAQAKGAKDLVIEVDARSAQPASYAVVPLASLGDGAMITMRIKLKHR